MSVSPDEYHFSDNNSLAQSKPEEKKWGWFHIVNIWVNDIQSLFGYTLAASLFISFGVSVWSAFAALVVAGVIVMVFINLSGRAGEQYGIPYPVFARASLGLHGAKLSSVLRAVVAVFWYGVQTYFASTAVHLLIVTFTGWSGGAQFLGLTATGWLAFFIVWALQMIIFSYGMKWINAFLNFAGPFVYAVMIALLAVLWKKSDGKLLSAVAETFSPAQFSAASEISGFVAIVGTMVAYFAAVMINFSDFSRYAKSRKSMVWGNLIGLPVNMVFFSALTLLITAGGYVVFGELLTNPADIVERAANPALNVIAALTFFAATVGINLVANFVPAINGIANLAPHKLSFKTSGLITSFFALIIGGLWVGLINSIGIANFVNTLSAALAPLYGILIADYYLIRKQKLSVPDLYAKSSGAYYYQNGWNYRALVAFIAGSAFSVSSVWVPALAALNGYAWIIGAGIGAIVYLVCNAREFAAKLASEAPSQ